MRVSERFAYDFARFRIILLANARHRCHGSSSRSPAASCPHRGRCLEGNPSLQTPAGSECDGGFCAGHPAAARGALYEVSWPGEAEGRAADGCAGGSDGGGDEGKIIEPGKSAESRLIHLVAGLEEDTVMPPKDKGERLTAAQIGLLRAWIDQGAEWPTNADEIDPRVAKAAGHWSFRFIPPKVSRSPVRPFAMTRNSCP